MLSKYLSGLVDSKFEDGAGGRGGWSVSPGFPCCVTFTYMIYYLKHYQ